MMSNRSGPASAQAKQKNVWAIAVRWFIVSVMALAVAVNIVAPVLAWRWTRLPFAGAVWEHTLVLSGVRGTRPWPLARATGLIDAERIVAFDGQPVARADELEHILATAEVGSEAQLTLEREEADGSFTRHRVTVPLTTFPFRDLVSLFLVPYLIGLVYLIVGAWVYWTRPERRASQAFAFFCANVALFTGTFFDSFTTHRLVWLWTAALPLLAASIVHLALVFPEERRLVRRYPLTRLLVYVPATILAIVAVLSLYDPTDPRAYFEPWRWNFTAGGLGVASFLLLLMYTRLRPGSAIVRQQARIVLLGSSLAFAPVGLWGLWAASGTQLPFYSFLYFLPMIVFPLTVAYAIVRYRLLDVDLVISRGVAYSLLTILVIVAYSAVASALGQLLRLATPASNPAVVALFILGLVLAIGRLRNWLQRLVDRVFYKERPDYHQALQEFSRTLTATLDLPVLLDTLLTRVGNILHVPQAAAFLIEQTRDEYVVGYSRGLVDQATQSVRFGGDDAITRWLRDKPLYLEGEERELLAQGIPQEEQARLLCLGVVLCVPLRVADRLTGWLALGPKSSQDLYSRDDLSFLTALADQAAIAIENACLLERTQRRARELATLNRVNRAVTSTLDLDGVLNQIMTNVVDILDTEAGSLMLLDENAGELVFQIFLGPGETEAVRHMRLVPGQGIAGVVAQQGQPLIVNKAAADPRWFPGVDEATGFVTRNILCVPLISRERTIGVIEVLNKRDGGAFVQEELNLLSSLASQTAIAIENARLYEQTQEEVRQLSLLFQASTAISSHLDLDTVVETVVHQLIEALGVEGCAISSWNREDDTVATLCEYHTADHDWDADAPGTTYRLDDYPATRRVLETRQPVVIRVDDPQADARERALMQTTELQTLLIMPLVVHERAIGIVELMESREAREFDEDDMKLCHILASQAAVAIENARLYTMTDEALAERVSELSVMQEIDRQLNATLDFERVMNLTMDWAIRITGAPVGVLALLDRENDRFRLLANRGYPERFVQDERRWSMDTGIVGRVVRTGQPALVPDVTQDPDYVNVVPSTRSQLTVPIWREDQVIAVINLESPTPGGFSEGDLAQITRLADHAAIAIENARLYADVKRANQAKSEFVSLVSHELKLPMTSIRGYAKMLAVGTGGAINERQRDFVDAITSNVDRMDTLVSDLLDISRIETGQLYLQLRPLVLHPLVEEVVRSMRDQIEARDLALTVDVPEDLPSVLADKLRIGQVLTNLVGNAYKYTPAGGRLDVRAKRMDGFVVCSVSDTGIGISPADQARLFDKFFRADHPVVRGVTGTGLGLSITKSIVELHGGEIWVESTPEAGSTFSFTLPVAGREARPAARV